MDSEDLEKYPDDERNQNEFIMGIQSISASATYLLLAFELEKLASCWYSAPLFTKDVIRKTLNLPETYIPMAFFTAGYSLSQIKAPKRKSLEDIIYNPKL
jgi:coenzyme F420-0:L-glutamate ligase/coenzyme F420-1:gamma-L-glutamate ligase